MLYVWQIVEHAILEVINAECCKRYLTLLLYHKLSWISSTFIPMLPLIPVLALIQPHFWSYQQQLEVKSLF